VLEAVRLDELADLRAGFVLARLGIAFRRQRTITLRALTSTWSTRPWRYR